MFIRKRELDRYLRSQKYNKTYITHVKDILRKNGVYEDCNIKIKETDHHYSIKYEGCVNYSAINSRACKLGNL